ncbi:hypothetical protein ADK90_08260 [Streptomyces sp. XY413]|uniref:hypothetical protein n=1 Tax=Streptomyces sp. XY413 TaxID=1519479 RepID=UPI0006AF9E27|nr:hypothetical protein [Streptomyces sp. XY413]KOV23876.1 hypothetical protein ADK90_08260 [Streptomyces sp. XY413]
MTFIKMTDRSVDASCLLGSVSALGTGASAISADRPALLATLAVSERNERPTQAPVAVLAAEAQAHGAYGFAAAAGAGSLTKQTKQQHHLMWAFRGLEPWSDPA